MNELAGKSQMALEIYEEINEQNPNDIEVIKGLYRLYHYIGENEEAIEQLKILKSLDPDSLKIRTQLIQLYTDEYQTETMIMELKELVTILEQSEKNAENNKRLINAYTELSNSYSLTQQLDTQLVVFKKLVDLNKNDKELSIEYIHLLMTTRRLPELNLFAEETLKKFPDDAYLTESIISISLYLQKFEKVEKYAENSLKVLKENYVIWSSLIHALYGQIDQPEKIAKYLQKSYEAYMIFRERIPIYDPIITAIDTGKFEYAKRMIDAWIKVDPKEISPWQILIYRYAPAMKMSDIQLFKIYGQAAEQFPNNLQLKEDMAYLAQNIEDWTTATPLMGELVNLHPDNYDFSSNYLYCLAQLKETVKYKSFLNRVLKRFPENFGLKETAAYQLQDQNNWKQALDLWNELIEIKPKDFGYHENRLFCLSKISQKTEYFHALNKTSQLFPKNKQLTLNTASLSQELNLLAAAADLWQKLIHDEPENYDYYQNLLFCYSKENNQEEYINVLFDSIAKFPEQEQPVLDSIYFFINSKNEEKLTPLLEKVAVRQSISVELKKAMIDGYDFLGSNEKVLILALELINVNPHNEFSLQKIIAIYNKQKQWEEAIRYSKRLIAINKNEDYRNIFKNLLQATEQWDELLIELKKDLAQHPRDISTHELLVYLYNQKNDSDKAIDHLKILRELNPGNSEYLTSLVYAYVDRHMLKPAISELESVWDVDGNDIEISILLADLYDQSGDKNNAIKLRRTILSSAGDNIELLLSFGQKFLWMNELKEAENIYLKILTKEPINTKALRALGRIHAWKNSPREAVKFFTRYLSLTPNDATIRVELGSLYSVLGSEQIATKEFELALEIMDSGIEVENPDLSRAKALAGLKRMNEAIPYFDKLTTASPQDGYLWGDYAEALVNNGFYEKAETILIDAPKSSKFYLRNRRLLARLFIEKRRYNNAQSVLEELWQRYPEDPGTTKDLAYVSELLERWPDALVLYQTVWNQEPELVDGHTDTAKNVLRIIKKHRPQIHIHSTSIENGDDSVKNTGLFYNYPLTNLIELQGDIINQNLEGPGLPGFSNIDKRIIDFQNNLIFRPGKGLKVTLGMLGTDNPSHSFLGTNVAMNYRQDNWNGEITLKWRESWIDPIKVVPFSGSKDSVSARLNWSPKNWFNANTMLNSSDFRFFKPPAGGSKQVYDQHDWNLGAEIRLVCVPQIWLTYNYSWLNGQHHSIYKPLINLLESKSTHNLGLRFYHDVNNCLTLFGSFKVGQDDKRTIKFSRRDLYSTEFGFVTKFSDFLELHGNFLTSTETSTGSPARYTENLLKMIVRF